MIPKIAFFTLGLISASGIAAAAPCSRINLTKCLDSACAINIAANPAARCQYCGTADAGEPVTSAMKSITAGSASKVTISDKELKKAPTDPGERYVWATKLCLTKVQNCTTDDVDEAYDPLIEKSCTAAGVASNMANLQKKAATNKRTEATCTNDVSKCVTASNRCDSDFSKCDDKMFDGLIATCLTQATGCTDFAAKVRNTISKNRTKAITSAKDNLDAVVASRKNARAQKLESVQSGCKNDADYEKCFNTACANNTNNNCETGAEKTIANSLCQYYKTACTKIK